MKKLLSILVLAAVALMAASCLKSNLELDTYDGKDITSIVGVYYRYLGDNVIPVSGEKEVRQVTLSVSNVSIDADAGTVSADVRLPSNFPAAQRDAIDATKLCVVVGISTAAVIEPIGNAPKFGVPGDWSKSNSYQVTAADNSTKNWTVQINFSK